jgi:ATP-dependent protease ClpP protease subunit
VLLRFYKSDRQDLAKHVEKELKQLELNRKALAKIRADKAGLTMEEYEKKYGADQSGTEARLHGILDEVTEETQSETPETLQAEPETAK